MDRWTDGRTDGWTDVRSRQDNGERAPPQVFPPRLLLFADAVCVFFSERCGLDVILFLLKSLRVSVSSAGVFFSPGLAVWYPVNLLSKTKTGGQLIALTSRSKWTRPDLISTLGECSLFFFCLLVLTIDHHRGNGGGGWMESHWGLEIEKWFQLKALPAAWLSGLRGLFRSEKR